jgi:hypothetical protein
VQSELLGPAAVPTLRGRQCMQNEDLQRFSTSMPRRDSPSVKPVGYRLQAPGKSLDKSSSRSP